eukprot:7376505-Prymnesium_polylepis.1
MWHAAVAREPSVQTGRAANGEDAEAEQESRTRDGPQDSGSGACTQRDAVPRVRRCRKVVG